MHVRKKSQAFELTPGQTLLISILEKLNYLRGSIGLCENHRRLVILLGSPISQTVRSAARLTAFSGKSNLPTLNNSPVPTVC